MTWIKCRDRMPEESKYFTCRCGFNPAINNENFKITGSECKFPDRVITDYEATCLFCNEKFDFYYDSMIKNKINENAIPPTEDISIVGDGFYFTKAEGNKILVKPNWIKCRDRMPEINQWVLTWNGEWHDTSIYYGEEDKPRFSDDIEWKKEVTHWMPLPSPPEDI